MLINNTTTVTIAQNRGVVNRQESHKQSSCILIYEKSLLLAKNNEVGVTVWALDDHDISRYTTTRFVELAPESALSATTGIS